MKKMVLFTLLTLSLVLLLALPIVWAENQNMENIVVLIKKLEDKLTEIENHQAPQPEQTPQPQPGLLEGLQLKIARLDEKVDYFGEMVSSLNGVQEKVAQLDKRVGVAADSTTLKDIQVRLTNLEQNLSSLKNITDTSKTSPDSVTVADLRNLLVEFRTTVSKAAAPSAPTQKKEDESTKPKLSGYMKSSFSYTFSDTKDQSETKVSLARIVVSGKLTPNTDYQVMIDAVKDEVLFDAFVVHKITQSFSAKIGQFKTPYSTDNLRSATVIAFIDRPYLKTNASPPQRDKGIMFAYQHKYFDFATAIMNGTGQNQAENNNNKSMAYRFVAKPLSALEFSANYYNGKNVTTDSRSDEYLDGGIHGTAKHWEYSAEYAQKKHGSLTKNACYAYLAYDIPVRSQRLTTITPAFRIEAYDPNTDISNNRHDRYTFGLTIHLGPKFTNRLMLNYELRNTQGIEQDDVLGMEYMVKF